MRNDRTLIEPLLVEHFPTMAGKSSQEWQAFLNEATGLDIGADEANGSAFDKWRQALAETQGLPVWGIAPSDAEAMKARAGDLLAEENERRSQANVTLLRLREEAPTK